MNYNYSLGFMINMQKILREIDYSYYIKAIVKRLKKRS